MGLSPGKLWGLRRLADGQGRFKMTAVDQRPPIKNLIKQRRGADEASYEDVCAVKQCLVRVLAPSSSALLLDPHVAFPMAASLMSPAQGLILTLEDSIFEEKPAGRLSSEIDHWSVAKIKRAGGDAVKVLAWYRPDADAAVCRQQEDFVARIGDACRQNDIPFVFELLVYPLAEDSAQTKDYIEDPGKRPELVLESVRRFADPRFGVDVFKLESPIKAAEVPDPENAGESAVAETQAWFDELGALAGRPWVMLSAGAGMDEFRRVLIYAYRAGASGYLAGRAIWWQAFQNFPDMQAMESDLATAGVPYMGSLNLLTDELATPWSQHPCYNGDTGIEGAGPGFRSAYPDFEGEI
ncbi:MAG: tagatose 1,6-diphosphate aldolase [Pseudomonadota bacterium]